VRNWQTPKKRKIVRPRGMVDTVLGIIFIIIPNPWLASWIFVLHL
jgi:hypothetical protein